MATAFPHRQFGVEGQIAGPLLPAPEWVASLMMSTLPAPWGPELVGGVWAGHVRRVSWGSMVPEEKCGGR